MGKNRKHREPEAPSSGRSPAEAPTPGWLQAKGPALRFVGIAGGLMLLFYGVFYTSPEESPTLNAFIRGYLGVFASTAAFLLRLFGAEAVAEGTRLVVGGRAVEIARGCDAMEPIALFVAALVAVQIPLRAKLTGIALGVPLLLLLNLGRIMALSWISLEFPEWFETAHVTVGQTVFILCTLCLWFVWVMRATRAPESAP